MECKGKKEEEKERGGKKKSASESFRRQRERGAKKKKKNSKKKNAPHDFPLAPLNHDASHSVHRVSCFHETGACPSRLGSRPKTFKKEGQRYHAAKMPTVAEPTYAPTASQRKSSHGVMSSSSEGLGGLVMMSGSGGLKPRAVAGGPSVTRLTQRSCTGMRPSGSPSAAVRKMEATSPTLDEII